MNQETKDQIKASVAAFRLPRYDQIPDVGLYLEQTVKYINEFLAPLGENELTSSMVSNYVKMKLIDSPVRKQYGRRQIAQLLITTLVKPVVALDNVRRLLQLAGDEQRLFDYFAAEFENLLLYVFDVKDVAEDVLPGDSEQADLMRNVILTAANKIYLDKCFAALGA